MNYNEKINYLMCKWLEPPRINHNEFNLRNAFYNKKEPTTKDEMRILAFKSAFSFLSQDSIDSAVKQLFAFYIVDEREADKLFNETKGKNVDFDLFTYIVTKSELPKAYLVLFFNALRVKNNEIPIIFRKDQVERIIKAIHQKKYNYAKEIYQMCLENTQKHLTINSLYKKEDIADKLKIIKKELSKLNVKEILIYGSFARDEATKHSDLDMVVLTRRKETPDDYLFAVQKLIEETLDIQIDMHFFSQKIDFSTFDDQINKDMMSILKI